MTDEQAELWNEFRQAGLLWFVNRIIHVFGWMITVEVDSGGIPIDVSVERTKWRGFNQEQESEGYRKLAIHIAENYQFMFDPFVSDTEREVSVDIPWDRSINKPWNQNSD